MPQRRPAEIRFFMSRHAQEAGTVCLREKTLPSPEFIGQRVPDDADARPDFRILGVVGKVKQDGDRIRPSDLQKVPFGCIANLDIVMSQFTGVAGDLVRMVSRQWGGGRLRCACKKEKEGPGQECDRRSTGSTHTCGTGRRWKGSRSGRRAERRR